MKNVKIFLSEEEEFIESVEKIKKCTSNCFFYIKCAQHNTILPNGELANCTVYPADWWECKLGEFFDYVKKIIVPDETSIAFITE